MSTKSVVAALLMSIASLSSMSVRDACEAWLESRRHHICPRTFGDYEKYIHKFSPFFGGLLISDIDGDHLRHYQHHRAQNVSPEVVNKELGVIIQVRKRINRPISDYQRLQQKKEYESPGRALSPSEQVVWERVCRAAADHHSWDVAALGSLLAMKTGMGPGEILSLKIKDVVFGAPSFIAVPRRGAKRVRRERTVVLLDAAEWAAQKLVKRAREKCGCASDDHFLIPFTNRDHTYDPERPPSTDAFREGIDHLQGIAGFKFRFYDMRHTAVSMALSSPKVSLSAATLHFGHISEKMRKRYYHGDLDTLKVVAAAIAGKKAAQKSQPVKKSAKSVSA